MAVMLADRRRSGRQPDNRPSVQFQPPILCNFTPPLTTMFPVSWNDSCHGVSGSFNYCSFGHSYTVDCSLTSTIDGHALFSVAYTEGTFEQGEGDTAKGCSEGTGGGNPQPPPDCDSYEIDISYDGGLSWTLLGTFSTC